MCGPEHGGSKNWDEEGLRKRKEYAEWYVKKLNDRNRFFIRLEESMLNQGFRNPILVNAGFCQPRKFDWLPLDMQANPDTILFTHSNGGSRLWVAVKLNIQVPCMVSDFIGRFENEPEIKNVDEFKTYYKDTLQGVVFGEYGVTIKTLEFPQ